MTRGDKYQIVLIALGAAVALFFGAFLYREVFPQYKLFQDRYIALEEFRSTYTGEPPPPFERGVKQIVIENPDKGPPTIDRCTSCHVAVQFEHFSPTKIARDINGSIEIDADGIPKKVPNENFVWTKLDEKIKFLRGQGKEDEAERLESLKTVHAGEHTFDAAKVLQMHPLIGMETRPFEYHPIDVYGCTSCHNGNGSALTFARAHGPVYDGEYEKEFMGRTPEFLEKDPLNDPKFAHVFNAKPADELLFQTTPIFVGNLIQAKCMNCHMSSQGVLSEAAFMTNVAAGRRQELSHSIELGFEREVAAAASTIELIQSVQSVGVQATIKDLEQKVQNYTLSPEQREEADAQFAALARESKKPEKEAIAYFENKLVDTLGSKELAKTLLSRAKQKNGLNKLVKTFVDENLENAEATGSLFKKARAIDREKEALLEVDVGKMTIDNMTANKNFSDAVKSEIDFITQDFHRGKELYISQACYACHRIEGFARGGVGPELTFAGNSYPWFLKESIVWPQADLKTSTMPNFRLDHPELEDLVTFLLAQHGKTEAVSETEYRTAIARWEDGKTKMPWEKPVPPAKLHDVENSMVYFAAQGCAACHRLKGFKSNVGFTVEKEKPDFETLYSEELWFQKTFPEDVAGSKLVQAIEKHRQEIDKRISRDVRENALLEKIETLHPGLIVSFYSNFGYAFRAKNDYYNKLAEKAKTPDEKNEILKELQEWKTRVRNVMMVYVQQYGLGRLIGPRPNWSGIYRSDRWLMQHFQKPTRHIPRSIMPVMPFDDSKFYALTYMLDMLALKNRDDVREIWKHKGFDPQKAFSIFCSQCHGEFLHGDGPVSKWIYPIPKNLANANFMRNYTKENVIYSVTHGIKGTPMPPWGEVAKDKPMADGIPVLTEKEIKILVDWLFTGLLGGRVIQSSEDVPKWQYTPEDIIEEMFKEKEVIKPGPHPQFLNVEEMEHKEDLSMLNRGIEQYLVSLDPMPAGEAQPKQMLDVQDVFNVKKNPEPSPEENLYFIKPEFYTDENLKAGQTFFELNCAICHGKEADGQGFRAGTMFEAKPRMLTNLHWIEMRDDLRLLRSIKYGVPGTAMTPWGDQTSALQRLQLVMYIRILSMEQIQREILFNALYDVFDRADQVLETGRIKEYADVDRIENKLLEISEEKQVLLDKVRKGMAEPAGAINLYKQELSLSKKLQEHKKADDILQQMQKELETEKDIYQKLGIKLIGKTIFGDVFQKYVDLIYIDDASYSMKNDEMMFSYDIDKEKKIKQREKNIIDYISKIVNEDEKRRDILLGKLPSKERREELADLSSDLNQSIQLKNDLVSGFEEAARSRRKQKELYGNYESKLKELKNDKI